MDDIFTSPMNTNNDPRNPLYCRFQDLVAEIANAPEKKQH